MPDLYPLCFRPLLRRYLWGGRRLERMLNKPLPAGDDYAESWELVDHGADQSEVADGPLRGQTLGRLVAEYGEQLLGRHHPQPRFPLLFKFLDAHRSLSVQVHPDDAAAARLNPPDLGKTEAWVVLHADPGSRIYAGLKPGFDRPAVQRELLRGTTEQCLHWFEPRVGQCVFLPAGTVHALGAGLVVAEIQQASDATFRLFDWNRVGADGKPRPLHVEAALDAIDYGRGPVLPQTPRPAADPDAETLVTCDKFELTRWRLDRPRTWGGDRRFHILSVVGGRATLQWESSTVLTTGQTILLPACQPPTCLAPDPRVELLDMCLP
ncbi:MAG: class I mannose-6-phosphate isomerase [Pirellulaceae bacterium]|nr:class I mannose-6-phosphate isomerase [Pirellulaceae bacterium]